MSVSLNLIAQMPGSGYLSIWKTILFLALLLIWGRALTWIDKDAQAAYLPRIWINLGLVVAMTLAWLMIFLPLPFFAVFPLQLILFCGSVGIYLAIRHSKVGLDDLSHDLKSVIAGKHKPKPAYGDTTNVVLFYGKNDQVLAVPSEDSPEIGEFKAAQSVLADALLMRAERIDLTPAERAAQVRFAVDGLAYNALSINHAEGALAVTCLKRQAGMDVNEKRKPQIGTTRVKINSTAYTLQVTTQGSTAGEFLKIIVDPKTRQMLPLDQLGLTPGQINGIEAAIPPKRGIILASAPRGHGLTTLLYAMLRRHDAFLQQIQTIERPADQELEGIAQNNLPSNPTPAQQRKLVDWICSQQPDILMVSLVDDAESAKTLAEFVRTGDEGHRLYAGLREIGALEAVLAWRRLVGDDRLALQDLQLVVASRIVRKLCNACKEAYNPDPEMLRKLNISPNNAETLYQERRTPIISAKGEVVPCSFCNELRFMGRFGIYEVLIVDDEMRQAIASGASINQLKTLFRKQRGVFLQEAALAAVQRGDTSVKEMVRVFKLDSPPVQAPVRGQASPHGSVAAPAGIDWPPR